MTTETEATAASSGAGATARFRENKHFAASTSQERVSTLAGRVIKAINDTVLDEKVTYDEYNAFKAWLIQVGEDGEWPLFLDVWVEHSVEEVANSNRHGSKGSIEGPYYIPDAPSPEHPGHPADARRRTRHPAAVPGPGHERRRRAARRGPDRTVARRRPRLLLPVRSRAA